MSELKIKMLDEFEWILLIIGIIMVIWRVSEDPTNFFDVIPLVSMALFTLVMQVLTVRDNKLENNNAEDFCKLK